MNRCCPTCGHDFTQDWPDEIVPYEENDLLFTLQFCSEECRDEYKSQEEDNRGD